MALASSSPQSDSEGQHAGAHAGLVPSSPGPLNTTPSAGSGQAAGQAQAPITVRLMKLGDPDPHYAMYEVVDATGRALTTPLVGQNSAATIANILDGYSRRDGLCLLHLTETPGGRCLGCVEGWGRHLLSAVPR